jgi:hypothetical protein
MTSKPNLRDYEIISLFLSGYENGSWADAEHVQPDKIERTKPAVDWLAIRKFDGKRLAIEHTLVEPFLKEKADFATFESAFLQIEGDKSLPVPGHWIQVFVPVGILRNRKKKIERHVIVESVRKWLQTSRLDLPFGISDQCCAVNEIAGQAQFEIILTVKVVDLGRYSALEAGYLHIRRQQTEENLDIVIAKALRCKVPKLKNTEADKRILLLERQHMNLLPERMLEEVEKCRPSFLELNQVDEIWIVETILHGTTFGGSYLRFEHYENGKETISLDFKDGKLLQQQEGPRIERSPEQVND